jgi:hypothetical protein
MLKILPEDDEKLPASAQRQNTFAGKISEGAAISVEDAIIIIRGLNLCGAHCKNISVPTSVYQLHLRIDRYVSRNSSDESRNSLSTGYLVNSSCQGKQAGDPKQGKLI